nr:hypothetical protein [uncultured Dyadobacter sp.]
MNKFYQRNDTTGFKWRSAVRLVAFAVFIALGLPETNAQDKIVLKDGKEIQAKILATEEPYIKYKRSDNLSGPDYFLYKSEVLRLDYDKNAGAEPQKLSAQTENAINKEIAELDLQLLEKKAKVYKRKSLIHFAIGTGAVVGGVATLLSVNGNYRDYKKQIRTTNHEYIAWYKSNYDSEPDVSDLASVKSFGSFGSPGIYMGAAALAGGLAFELLGIKNTAITRKIRKELAEKRKQLSWQPFYQHAGRTGGIRLSLRF